jgi:hypothetical protein
MSKSVSTRADEIWDRQCVAILGIFLIAAVSFAPHFALPLEQGRPAAHCDVSHSKQPCLASDTVAWSVPYQQATMTPFLPSSSHFSVWDEWICSPRYSSPQLYDRPPPYV